jgi:hypothetical protein
MASEIIKAHITGVRMAAGGAGGAAGGAAGKVAGAVGGAGGGMTLTDDFGTPMNIPTQKTRAEKLGVGDAAGKQRAFVAGSLILGTALDTYAIVSEQIGNAFKEEADVMTELSEATIAASNNGGTIEDQKAALARLEKANAAALNANPGGGFVDSMARGILGAGHALGINDAPTDTSKLAEDQFAAAGTAMARRKHDIEQLQNKPTALPSAAAAVGSTETVKAKADSSPRMIAAAMATALGGKVLTVRIANAGELGLGRASPGPGGSRGPMVARPTAPGGGT